MNEVNELKRRVRELEVERDAAREKARRLGIDAVTGAPTRGSLNMALERMAHAAIRDDLWLGVLMIDADHFKVVNDTHGHAVGDAVLGSFSVAIRTSIRGSDTYGRFGGDEFTVAALFNGSPEAELYRIAERIRAGVAEIPVEITASIGGVICRHPGRETLFPTQFLNTAVEAADAMLYAVKAGGRNNVSIVEAIL